MERYFLSSAISRYIPNSVGCDYTDRNGPIPRQPFVRDTKIINIDGACSCSMIAEHQMHWTCVPVIPSKNRRTVQFKGNYSSRTSSPLKVFTRRIRRAGCFRRSCSHTVRRCIFKIVKVQFIASTS